MMRVMGKIPGALNLMKTHVSRFVSPIAADDDA